MTELAVICGQRRLGKTRLVKQALGEYGGTVFYQARQKARTLQLEQFVETAGDAFPGVERIRQDCEPPFEYLADQDAIIVLDKFSYLIEQDESLPSVLQALFDHEFDESAATFVLVGSSISCRRRRGDQFNGRLFRRLDRAIASRSSRADAIDGWHHDHSAILRRGRRRTRWFASATTKTSPIPVLMIRERDLDTGDIEPSLCESVRPDERDDEILDTTGNSPTK